jgi:hypothetical protein
MRKLRFSTDAGFFSILKIIITREQLVDFWGKEINESLVCYMPKRLILLFYFPPELPNFFCKEVLVPGGPESFQLFLFRKVKRKTLFAFTIYELYFHVVI